MTERAVPEHVAFTGEPLAVDLVNTRPVLPDGRIDLLGDGQGLRDWLILEADRLPSRLGIEPDAPAQLGPEDIAAVHQVRQHAEAAIDRARRSEAPSADALDGLNQAQWAAPSIRELAWEGARVTSEPARSGPLGAQLAATLAEATAELLASPAITKIRQCEADDCVMLFLPAHPRRRWCSAERCGNRVRVSRHYHRHKGG